MKLLLQFNLGTVLAVLNNMYLSTACVSIVYQD